jgi:hypothetical protein
MKFIKGLVVIALISAIAISCKDTKKEELSKEGTEVVTETKDAVKEVKTETAAPAATTKASENTEKVVETTTKGLNELPVAEGIIYDSAAETPVAFPGCEGTNEEIRACSLKEFKKNLAKNFDKDLMNRFDLQPGQYKVRTILKVDASGKASVVRVDGSTEKTKAEIIKLIDKLPVLKPATVAGNPVEVYYVVPITFKVEN